MWWKHVHNVEDSGAASSRRMKHGYFGFVFDEQDDCFEGSPTATWNLEENIQKQTFFWYLRAMHVSRVILFASGAIKNDASGELVE